METQDLIAPVDARHNGSQPAPQAAAVLEEIRSGEIGTVVVGGCDLSGVFRAKRISPERFLKSAQPVMKMSEYIFAIDIADGVQPPPDGYEGWWPSVATGMSDIEAVADLSTLRRMPWLDRTAVVLCDYRHPDGRDYECAPRNVLRRVLERYVSVGLEPRLAPEFEFIVYRESEGSAAEKGFRDLTPLYSTVAAFGSTRSTIDSHIIMKIVDDLVGLRVPVEAWNPEAAPGQYELNIEHAPALEAADRGFLLKIGVKEICALEGMLGTFMSKLAAGVPGNSMHVHQSLWRDGEPAFSGGDDPEKMSDLLRHFVAGQLRTLIPFAPVWMPNPAALKRPAPYMGAGGSENWGGDNRMLSIRVLGGEPTECRVEHRLSGGDANPYLAIAAMLAGGLHGIENELDLPEPTTGDAFSRTDLKPTPKTMDAALGAFEESPAANEYLGEEFVKRYAATRRWEEEQALQEVTDWELKRYLTRS